MVYGLLADLLVAVHLGFVVFVVGSEALIVVGAFRGWRWIRGLVFRLAHVAAIVFVAAEAVTGTICPLTQWEWALRNRAGQAVEDDISFVGRLLRAVIYYELPPIVFTVTYVAFAVLVVATLVAVPPRRGRGRHDASLPGA